MHTCLLLVWFVVATSAASWTLCPPNSAHNVRDGLALLPQSLVLQRGLWQRVPCPTFRPTEVLDGVLWYRVYSDTNETRLISRDTERNYTTNERYGFSSESSLLIKGVKESDEGTYLCRVVPRDTLFRDGRIDVKIIGDSFLPSQDNEQASAPLQRGQRNKLPCDCATDSPHATSAVYWSTGEGVSTDTEIIGARFADGSVLQIQHAASYGIGSEFSLDINSLVGVHDKQRFWCHVFKSDDTRRSCYTDVTMTGDQPPDSKLRASKSSFYLLNGKPAILPCTSWELGELACDAHWFKVNNNSDRHLLTYNLSTGNTRIESGFDLASDFGLIIESAHSSHSGRYSCRINSKETNESLEVRIVESHFPLDGGDVIVGETITPKPNRRLTLKCPVEFNNIPVTKTTLFWSFGAPDEQQSTTVIGNLVLPKGIRTMSDLGDSSCYGISYEGSLTLTNCPQDNDVRYWCHVFKEGEGLQRSYVDVKWITEEPTSPPSSKKFTIIIVVLSIIIILPLLVVFVWRRRRNASLSQRVHDPELRYEMVQTKGGPPALNVDYLTKSVRAFVKASMDRLPISPWAGLEEKDYAAIEQAYIEPEMFVHVPYAGYSVKCRLESASELFSDGIPELSNRHVLIQGRAGIGKSVLLYKLAYDWAMGRSAILEKKRVVFYLPATVLAQVGSLGKAVVKQYRLEPSTGITPESIEDFCFQSPEDVAILIDGCISEDDTAYIQSLFEGLQDCHAVITTRCKYLTQSLKTMRYITIGEFTREKAFKYIRQIASVDECSQAKLVPDTFQKDVFSDLRDYLEKDLLPPKVAFLPANLTLMYQLCLWTEGEVFRSEPSMGKLILESVKCMFERSSCQSRNHSGNQVLVESSVNMASGGLTESQLDILDKVGRIVWELMSDGNHSGLVVVSKSDFLTRFPGGDAAFDECVRTSILCCTEDRSRSIMMKDGSQADGSTLDKDGKVSCALEILQEFYTGVFIARSTEKSNTNPEVNSDRMANIVAFASRVKPDSRACSALVEQLVKSFKVKKEEGQFSEVREVSNLQQLCLFLNFEGVFIDDRLRKSVISKDRVCLVGISRHILQMLSRVLVCPSGGGKERGLEHRASKGIFKSLKSVELFRVGTKHDLQELQVCLAMLAPKEPLTQGLEGRKPDEKDGEDHILRQILQRVHCPVVPPDQSNVEALHAIQNLGLQELADSQYGECHSSEAAKAVTQNLSHLHMLEEVVLLGTILDSSKICIIAEHLDCLPKLKKLDLRLNECFDDKAFVAVTKSLHRCKSLSDFRLSLCKVTQSGFDAVHQQMEAARGGFWSNLETLYLLQGSPVEIFLAFLSKSLAYFHFVKSFHISSSRSTNEVSDDVANEFRGKLTDDEIMPNLKGNFVIGNMPGLDGRLRSTHPWPEETMKLEESHLIQSNKCIFH